MARGAGRGFGDPTPPPAPVGPRAPGSPQLALMPAPNGWFPMGLAVQPRSLRTCCALLQGCWSFHCSSPSLTLLIFWLPTLK